MDKKAQKIKNKYPSLLMKDTYLAPMRIKQADHIVTKSDLNVVK